MLTLRHTQIVAAALVALLLAVPAGAAEAPSGADMKFVTNAARDGETEVALGKLAVEKASSEEVKKFGQQMVDDHSKANEELKAIAQSKEIDLTKGQEAGKKKSERLSQKLSKLEGDAFDKGYIAVMVKEHERDVKLFEQQSEKGQDAELKAFAAKTLPTLQHHLEMAKDLQSKVGGGKAGGGKKAEREKKDAPTE